MNLVTDRMGMYMDGSSNPDLIVAARLRFDLSTARLIRDQLDTHLSGITSVPGPAPDVKPN